MARIFIGCRVRITHVDWTERGYNAHLVGKEAIVIGRGKVYEWRVEVIGHGRIGDRGGKLAFNTDQLSPIIPDGHRAGVKGECSLLDELLSREVKNETVK